MYLNTVFLFSLVASTLALPTAISSRPHKRAILTTQSYSQFQVSNGVGGNALAEVAQKFPVDESNLADLDPEDLAIIKAAGEVAEDAEVGPGGFNEAIEAAGGKNTAAGKALQVGKIKNKVLKLQLSVLALGAEVAQGRTDRAAKLQEQKTKLAKNVQLDEDAAGQRSTPVNFQG
ncbi:hypothetical protein B0T16DRAFT_315860 [Cercophora newfieldiana]|uniref:Small secreted protein n=1 Tax=Cercophora newfieldiana TaxID=92897 RepID=A0AA39YQ37_9PEZI|nr:hypothetical protein B0T16DRAFT_315860 [Cercophora newfieldiana]